MDLELVRKINDSPFKVFAAITGGGQTFIGDYLSISGASKTIVGALVPYSSKVFDKFVRGARVDSYASEDAARKLAVAAYNECLAADTAPDHAIGLGASCSLAKDNEREGRAHSIHVAVHWRYGTSVLNVSLLQGRTRQEEEHIARTAVLLLLAARVLGTPLKPTMDKFITLKGEKWGWNVDGNDFVARVVEGQVPSFQYAVRNDKVLPIYSGSFNPWHEGHEKVYRMAEKILEAQPVLELSVTNVDKGQLDFIDVGRRLHSMVGKPYIVSNSSRFIDKAHLLRNLYPNKPIVFIVGADTWNRIWDEKYGVKLPDLLMAFKAMNVKFLVFGRKGFAFETDYANELRIPSAEAEALNLDYSSSAIRKEQLKHA